jgi:MYXO-CTERM domain-containing protein
MGASALAAFVLAMGAALRRQRSPRRVTKP